GRNEKRDQRRADDLLEWGTDQQRRGFSDARTADKGRSREERGGRRRAAATSKLTRREGNKSCSSQLKRLASARFLPPPDAHGQIKDDESRLPRQVESSGCASPESVAAMPCAWRAARGNRWTGSAGKTRPGGCVVGGGCMWAAALGG